MIGFLTHPVILLTIGGAAGTNLRYWLGRTIWFWSHQSTQPFPLATFLINVTGSLLLALLVLPFRERMPTWYILLGVGFCGGYTTFSTFALETVELIRVYHRPDIAFANILVSVVAGCLVTWMALAGAERFYPLPSPGPAVMEVADPGKQMEP
ncbi:MAG: fluoride efflux transporter CrcB [Gemmataceae bacterium]|nr:fluoride efflux transporter CrcB [Gemmataceae bacterium]